MGSNRQFIEDEIPHIGTLLRNDLREVVKDSEIVVIGTNAFEESVLQNCLRPDQTVIDLVSAIKPQHMNARSAVHGLHW